MQPSHSQGMSEKTAYSTSWKNAPRLIEATSKQLRQMDNNVGVAGYGAGSFNPKVRQIASIPYILTHPLRYLKHGTPM